MEYYKIRILQKLASLLEEANYDISTFTFSVDEYLLWNKEHNSHKAYSHIVLAVYEFLKDTGIQVTAVYAWERERLKLIEED